MDDAYAAQIKQQLFADERLLTTDRNGSGAVGRGATEPALKSGDNFPARPRNPAKVWGTA